MKIILGTITVLAIAGLALGGCAHRYKDPEKRAEYFNKKVSKRLDLNDAQNAKLEAVSRELLKARTQMKGKRDATRQTLHGMLNQPTLDQEKILSIYKEHVDDMNTHAPTIVAAVADFWASLTPEQQAKVREKMSKHLEGRGHWGHWGRPHTFH